MMASKDIQIGDLDHDGDLDFFVPESRGSPGQPDHVYINRINENPSRLEVITAPVNNPADDHDGTGNGIVPRGSEVGYASIIVDISRPGGGTLDGFKDIITVNGSDFMRVLINKGTTQLAFVDEGGKVALNAQGTGYIPDPTDLTKRIYNTNLALDTLGPRATTSTGVVLKTSLDDIDVGDIDLDGDYDLVVSNRDNFTQFTAPNLVFRNDGTGVFQIELFPTSLESVATVTHDVVLGDIDNDGDLDLLTVNPSGPAHLFRNKATSIQNPGQASLSDLFEDKTSLLGDQGMSPSHRHGALVDLNGDGLRDIHLGNGNVIYWNVGVGQDFMPENVTFGAYSAFYTDVNNDGSTDIIVVNCTSARVCVNCIDATVNTNPFGIVFQQATGVLPTTGWITTLGVAAGDIDGDGDVDIAVSQGDSGSTDPNRVFLNKLVP